MKKLTIFFILLSGLFCGAEALTYKPFYVGDSKCYQFMIKDQNGAAMEPSVGDVVTLTLKRTPTSTPDLLVITGSYVAENDNYNYIFSADSDETTSLATGDAYWYLELTNASNKINIVIDVSKITIKR